MKYEGIAEKLYNAADMEKKFQVLEAVVLNAGFDALLYTFIPKLALKAESIKPVFQYSEHYKPFIEHYFEHDYNKHDFLIRLVESGEMDFIDWWEVAESIELSSEEKHVNSVARHDFGISKGITFPTLSSDAGIAGVCAVQIDRKVEPVNKELLRYLQACSRVYHDHMIINQDDRYNFILPILESLTPRKKAVLKHLISGKPMKKIVEQGISERYADKLLFELRKEFGNISKNEFIYMLGLLNISEYL